MNKSSIGIAALMLLLATVCSMSNRKNHVFNKVPKKDRIDLAAQQEFLYTKDPTSNTIPKNRLVLAQKEVINMRSADYPISWEEYGPSNVAGRVRAILATPSDEYPNQVYIGSASGGLWKTNDITDEYVTWEDNSENLASLSVCALAGDASNLYIGTGEGYFTQNSFTGVGMYKRGNDTNIHLESTNNDNYRHIQSILKADNGFLLIASKESGIQLSMDNGASWTKTLGAGQGALSNRANSLVKLKDGKIMASMGIHDTDGIYISDNNGFSWERIMNGIPTENIGRIELSCSPSNSKIAYALISNINNGTTVGLFKTLNQGATWYKMSLPSPLGMSDMARSQSWYNLCIATSPVNPNKIVIGGIDLFVSTNGGLSFEQISNYRGLGGLNNLHADQHELQFLNNDDLLVGNDGGVHLIKDVFDKERSIISKNHGLNITQFYACDIHPIEDEFLAGAQDNGTQKFTSRSFGETQEVTGGDGARCFYNEHHPNIQISSYVKNNYFVSTDGGINFQYFNINNNGLFANPADYDSKSNVLYAADRPGYMMRWSQPGNDGSYSTNRIYGLSGQITAIKLSDHIDDRLYVGTSEGAVYRVDNAKSNFKIDGNLIFRSSLGGTISDVILNPNNEDHLIVLLSNYGLESVHVTYNGGESWVSCEGNLPDMPVRSGVMTLESPEGLYIATDLGVWYTEKLNGTNTTWINLSQGMTNVRVDMLDYRASDGLIVAATHGRGLFGSIPHVSENHSPKIKYELSHSYTKLDLEESLAYGASCGNEGYSHKLNFQLNEIPKEDVSFDVNLEFANASAKDLKLQQDIILFEKGKKYANVSLALFDDYQIEGQEIANLIISSDEHVVKSNKQIEITISDDDYEPKVQSASNEDFLIGTEDELSYEFPLKAYYEDQRTQMYFTADELKAAGMLAGDITALQFKVNHKKSDMPFEDFSIYLNHTSSNGGLANNTKFHDPGTEVYNGNIETVQGWNTISFDKKFEWDGKSNLLLQMCFNNSDWSNSDQVVCTNSGFYSVHYNYADSHKGCELSSIKSVSQLRPVINFMRSVGDIRVASEVYEVSSYIGSGEEAVFLNNKGELMAKIKSTTQKDLGCVSLAIVSEGQGSWCDEIENLCFSDKMYYVDTQYKGAYELSIYFNDEELKDFSTSELSIATSEDYFNNNNNNNNQSTTIKDDVQISEFGNSSLKFTFNDLSSKYFLITQTGEHARLNQNQNSVGNRLSNAKELVFYPNPFINKITAQVPEDMIGLRAVYSIYQLDGKKLFHFDEILTKEINISIPSSLKSGSYMVKIITEGDDLLNQTIIKI